MLSKNSILKQSLRKLVVVVVAIAAVFFIFKFSGSTVTVKAAEAGRIGGVTLQKVEYDDSDGYLVVDEGNLSAALRYPKITELRLVAVTDSEIALLEKSRAKNANDGQMIIISRPTHVVTPFDAGAEYWNTTQDNSALLFTRWIESPPGTKRLALEVRQVFKGETVIVDTLPLPPACQSISNASFSPNTRYIAALCVTNHGGTKKNIAKVYVADRTTGAVIGVQDLVGPYTPGEERPFVEKYFKWDEDGTVSAYPPQLERTQ